MKRPRNQRIIIVLLLTEEFYQMLFFDIAVVLAVGPIAEIVISHALTKELHNASLSFLFDLADGTHIMPSPI